MKRRPRGGQCYGVSYARLCEAVAAGANGSPWCSATKVVGVLRSEVPPESATRLYFQWGNHEKSEEYKRHPADVQLDQGRRMVVYRLLSNAKRLGLLEVRDAKAKGARREFRLTDKGRALLNGKGD